MRKVIPYYRVSTARQGRSGLGLEAQQTIIRDFARLNDLLLLNGFTEVESGRNNKRPVLKQALKACEKEKAALIIAKLDRLSRSVSFLSTLMETKAEFIAIDMPYADKFFIHIMAAVAQYQAEEAGRRTKAALQEAKQRGTELGKHGKYILSKRNRDDADLFALKMQPVIRQLNQNGFKTIRTITKELNKRKIYPYSGNKAKWHNCTVFNLLHRLEKME